MFEYFRDYHRLFLTSIIKTKVAIAAEPFNQKDAIFLKSEKE
ncbi:MAG: hypothetical protein E7D58_02465 [Haemophilus parainfluenzae]|nr:hypothetical protein [Haemophilus parainfluenzae]MDU2299087.1 hypothetical protein [Haemophilus parainfluenzae]MDU2381567.1 hypothetical protein [Haemophilus parainfluenzae]MDU5794877.1 hypothetical protein [Haemophilus parainfluenzae]